MTAFWSSNIYIFACRELKFVTVPFWAIIADNAFKSREPQYIFGSLKAVIKSNDTFSFLSFRNSSHKEYLTNGEVILIEFCDSDTKSRKICLHGFFSTFIIFLVFKFSMP